MRKLAPAALVAGIVLLSFLIPCAAQAAAPGPWVGTWILDTAKSKVAPNRPTGLTLIFTQADAAMIAYTLHFSTAQGQSIVSTYAGKPDNQPHPATINGKAVSQAAYSWTSPKVLHGLVSGGSGPEELVMTMGADGKTFTETRKKKTPAPGDIEEKLVFNKKG